MTGYDLHQYTFKPFQELWDIKGSQSTDLKGAYI